MVIKTQEDIFEYNPEIQFSSCQIDISFETNSLANKDDLIIVQTDTILCDANKATVLSEPILDYSNKILERNPQYMTKTREDGELIISHDYGITWQLAIAPPPFSAKIKSICLGKRVQVCVGRFEPIYFSLDQGDTWMKCPNQPQIRDWSLVTIDKEILQVLS